VLFFETNDGGFVPPAAYPAKSVAVAGSHDLPTVRGWWAGLDIDLKEQLGLYPDPAGAGQARLQRTLDRAMLVRALRQEQLVADELDPELLFRAVHVFLARSRSFLAVAQIDDITDELEPVNIPSTSAEHPNWRRRLALTLEQIEHAPRLDSLARLMNSTRGIGDAA
jgi:4-alpha-glucanotransferase